MAWERAARAREVRAVMREEEARAREETGTAKGARRKGEGNTLGGEVSRGR